MRFQRFGSGERFAEECAGWIGEALIAASWAVDAGV